MASQYRPVSVYSNGKRIASATNGEWTPSTSGGEDVIDEDGHQGVTGGAEINEVTIDRAIKYLGDGHVLKVGDMVTVTLGTVNTQVITIPNMTVMEVPVTWDHVKGTVTGKLRFRGGKATRTG